MNLLYLTSKYPCKDVEQFVGPEIDELINQNQSVSICPTWGGKLKQHSTRKIIIAPLFSFLEIHHYIYFLTIYPRRSFLLFKFIFFESESSYSRLVNLLLFFKAMSLAARIKGNIDHIHAYWASSAASLAFFTHILTKIPWSFSGHRGDLFNANMINRKFKSSIFVRLISQKSEEMLYNKLDLENKLNLKKKSRIIPCGVETSSVLESPLSLETRQRFSITVPASFYEVKGHKYLIEALNLLKESAVDFECHLFGDGPLEPQLKKQISKYHLDDNIFFHGQVSHSTVLDLYKTKMTDLVVIPSILTQSGIHEGIPVALMEAMANHIPVISTRTGGIAELLEDIPESLVNEKNSLELKEAIHSFALNPVLRKSVTVKAYEVITQRYDIKLVATKIINEIEKN